jgi:DNA-binding transcriptional ArsR family regulator
VPLEPPRVSVRMGSSFELLAALWAFVDESHRPLYEISSDWLQATTDRMGPDARAIRRVASGSLRFWDHVLGLALEAGEPYEVDGLVSLIRKMEPGRLRLHLLGRYNRPVCAAFDTDRIEAAAAGDAAEQRAFRRAVFPDEDAWQRAVRHVFRTDPEAIRGELLHALELWIERFWVPEAGRIVPVLEREHESSRRLALQLEPMELIDQLTDSMRWAMVARLSDVLLAPSFVARPIVFYVEHREMTLVLYPVSDASVQGDAFGPPARLVRLAKALADEGRLRVLHALRERELTAREIAERLGVPRTSIFHHILILKDAGLVRSVPSDRNRTRFELRVDAIPDIGELLEQFLADAPPARLARPVGRG